MPIHISNGTIIEISSEEKTTFVTVNYIEHSQRKKEEKTIRLVITRNTILLNENGLPILPNKLRIGMTIHASFSPAMTRSIPPQANAYFIQIVRRESQESITVGTLLNVDEENRSFTTINPPDTSSIIRFHVTDDAKILSPSGTVLGFRNLNPGMRVEVRHANFMTASIPPQTTAFKVQIL